MNRCSVPGCWIEAESDGTCAEHRDEPDYRYESPLVVTEHRTGADYRSLSRTDRRFVRWVDSRRGTDGHRP